MDTLPRHRCLVYDGPPSRHLQAVAAAAAQNLAGNRRCLYLNSAPMVAGMRSYLAAAGLDVSEEIERGRLVLSSEQGHLDADRFDVDRMMDTLESALTAALRDGYSGLWATGDMTWELGPRRDFGRLLEYEWRLEEFLQAHPEMGGICQYHADTLPREALREGLVAHPTLFVSETLSRLNPHYVRRESFTREGLENPAIGAMLSELLSA